MLLIATSLVYTKIQRIGGWYGFTGDPKIYHVTIRHMNVHVFKHTNIQNQDKRKTKRIPMWMQIQVEPKPFFFRKESDAD